MLKVLHYGLSSNRGGIETSLYKIWRNIDRNLFHFDFIDTNIDEPCFYNEFTELGSNFHKITPRSSSVFQNRRDLEILFNTHKFDVLHCHLNTLSYIEPIKIALKHNCRVIVHSRSAGSTKTVKTLLLHYINSLWLPKDKIERIAVSKLAGEWIFGKKSNFEILNNGIEIEKFAFNSLVRKEKKNMLKLGDKFIIGHIGAFLPVKNHKFVVKVFNKIHQKNTNTLLLLVGTGPELDNIKKLVKKLGLEKDVIFAGRRSDIPDLLSVMDCFIFPSFFEGFPNSVIEAQTSGIPCYISDEITEEVIVTDLCHQLPLKNSIDIWVDKILSNKVVERAKYSEVIRNKGFSVEEEILKLKRLYHPTLE